ncbi:MAG: tRNA (adenosine(37)-N6)-threonylcarbamoyltransferase complex transferase subunit TsaD [Chloroflexi bacterium]|jgi:N6-L-threonylcarbamoyladenine synthase|nr:tRNA (adenosine(37)-N6)-threonylcarbamoyltransferase complex transferase subunit TsaD [Chloroflexota bacterium]MBT7082373.1 tRNA (adenosine(37)-N6)-threonylcarbamoyltransferase complex transferase subunit TsaD [Chloroflexota bacterium]MBT7290613.1 tRNA (adenosine(37)-N6)-threonylcarbamoyltransferase complex transferase subunit TsaD [Chloroflexota bacterium]
MKILGIESSCDETAAAVVENGVSILSSVVASQVDIHARYGGIVPEVASRQHLLSIIPIVQKAMGDANVVWDDIDAIAVTNGPGLAGSLLVGLSMAKTLSWAHNLPLVGVNHLEGHIYANWLTDDVPDFPLICLIVSGGHSDLILMRDHGDYVRLGRTRDDAAGEAFDKVARVLGVGYPGGPAIEKASLSSENSAAYPLPRAWLKGTYDFSFSGLKTAVLRLFDSIDAPKPSNDIAASFQEAVVDVLATKTVDVAQKYKVKRVIIAGGVAANKLLRSTVSERCPIPVSCPPLALCTDNAAMIAACGYFRFKAGQIAGLTLDVQPNLKLG